MVSTLPRRDADRHPAGPASVPQTAAGSAQPLRCRTLGYACCVVLTCCAWSAATDQALYLPMSGEKIENGLKMVVEMRWVDANGYRPVRVRLIHWPPGPAKQDRRLEVTLEPMSVRWRGSIPRVTQEIVLPEGSSTAESIISVPQDDGWSNLQVQVRENGRRLKDLSTQGWAGLNYAWYEPTEAAPVMLFITSAMPDARSRNQFLQRYYASGRTAQAVGDSASAQLPDFHFLASLFPASDGFVVPDRSDIARRSDIEVLALLDQNRRVEMLALGELPTKWLDYTCFDLVFISWNDLQALQSQHPDRWQAIRKWTASGPTLCVYGIGDRMQRLAELEQLMGMQPSESRGDDDYRGWTEPDPELYGSFQIDQNVRMGPVPMAALEPLDPAALDPAVADPAALGPPPQTPFIWKPYGVGRVLAIAAEDPFPGRLEDWAWLFNSLDSSDWKWYQRHGVSMHRENREYWNLLLPGLGAPPVTLFLVSITLFVVIIGPVNYYFLRRARKLFLLLVTVPLGAAIVAAGLLGFAILKDGLGVKARVRSFTHLDQRSGQMVSWSRQTYYASLTPSRGLVFPDDTAVYPVEYIPEHEYSHSGSKRSVEWQEGEQSLRRGYLLPRTPTQVLTVRSADSSRKLEIDQSAPHQPPRVTNRLGHAVRYLLLKMPDEQLYWLDGLDAGASATGSPIDEAAAVKKLRPIFQAVRPRNPDGYDPYRYRHAFDMGARRIYSSTERQEPPPSFSTSILEDHLRQLSDARKLPSRSYLAFMDETELVPLGITRAKQQSSLNVIHGKW